MESKLEWWGYTHQNMSVQAKRYFSKLDITEANDSPFCIFVTGPFLAKNREEALQIVKDKYNQLIESQSN